MCFALLACLLACLPVGKEVGDDADWVAVGGKGWIGLVVVEVVRVKGSCDAKEREGRRTDMRLGGRRQRVEEEEGERKSLRQGRRLSCRRAEPSSIPPSQQPCAAKNRGLIGIGLH
jgi:hypothetical protein